MMAGIFFTLALDTPNAVGGIGDAVEPSLLARSYHDALSAVINQHCFNLLSIGTFALAGAVFIWRMSVSAILHDCNRQRLGGCQVFFVPDLGGFASFVPGASMMSVSSAALILSQLRRHLQMWCRNTPVFSRR